MVKPFSELYDRIQYTFKDEGLCLKALSHRSSGQANNERLEFLGDAVLTLLATDYLFQRFPHAKEGSLSRLRARLVSGTHLASSAMAIGLGEFLRLGPGEMRSGGYRRDSILENAFEALLGAIYVDGGLEAARSVVHHCFKESFAQLDLDQPTDAKTELQEQCQKLGQELPVYSVLSVEGEPHSQIFSVSCKALDQTGVGQASSRKSAEQKAASEVLKQLGLLDE